MTGVGMAWSVEFAGPTGDKATMTIYADTAPEAIRKAQKRGIPATRATAYVGEAEQPGTVHQEPQAPAALGTFLGRYSRAVDLLESEYTGPAEWEAQRVWLNERLGLGLKSADEIENQERQERVERFWENFDHSGIPRRYAEMTADSYEALGGDLTALRKAGYFVAGKESGAYFHGPLGRGKTWLLTYLGRTWMKKYDEAVYFGPMALLLDQMRDEYGPEAKAHVFATTLRVPLLLLDDLGTEKPTEWAVGRMYEIVNARLAAGRPTVYSSNLGLDELEARLAGGDPQQAVRIVDRIREQCGANVIEVNGEKVRPTGGR